MKIAYITMSFPVKSETFACNDIRTLIELGHEVQVFCLRPFNKSCSHLLKERNLELLPVFYPTVFGFFKSFFFFLKSARTLKTLYEHLHSGKRGDMLSKFKNIYAVLAAGDILPELQRFSPNVIHCFWGHYPSVVGYLAEIYLPNVRITTFLGAHDLNVGYVPGFNFANRAHRVFTHTVANVPLLVSAGVSPDKISVVYRGIDVCHIKTTLEKKLTTPFVFCTAGRLIYEKRIDLSIQLVNQLILNGIPSVLHIFGDGPELETLKSLVNNFGIFDHVIFHGHRPQYDLFSVMEISNFFILFTEYESDRLPNVLKEAMYRSCLCLTSKTLGIEELIEDGIDGFVFANNYVNSAFDVISNLSEDNYRFMCNSSREKVLKKFTAISSMKQYIEIWNE